MKKIIPIILLFTIFLTACGKKAETQESPVPPPVIESEKPNPSPSPTPETEPFRAKLTGQIIESEPDNNRPYAVMINNISVAQPLCGVSQADILYEVLAEGEITRILAIFSDISDVEKIGSMRSARPYYIELARSYDAVYVHAGGSVQAYNDISSKRVNNIDGVNGAYGGEIFYRDPLRMKYGSEHSLFTSGEKILEYMPKFGYATEHADENYDYGLTFSDKVIMTDSAPATSVDVSFSGLKHTKFTYSNGHYAGMQYGKDLIDGNNEETVLFKNLLVLYADTKVLDNEGRRSVNLVGTGNGHFFCDGQEIDITWSRDGDGQKFSYYLPDGMKLTLGVGTSYIAIVPTGSTITFE